MTKFQKIGVMIGIWTLVIEQAYLFFNSRVIVPGTVRLTRCKTLGQGP